VTRTAAAVSALAVLLVAFAAVTVIAVVVAGHERDDFDSASVTTLTDAFRSKGLTVCETSTAKAVGVGAISSELIAVAAGNCDDSVAVQVDGFDNRHNRDAAARNAELHARPRVFGTVYTWHRYTVYLQADDASADSSLVDQVVQALDSVGAH
jgi:hypothetical protein